MAIGHSFGANALTNVALLHPRLFTSLVLIDPVISCFASTPGEIGPAAASTYRRDVWPSRKDAIAAFDRSPFYKTWDPRVLDQWVKYGIREIPGQEAVTLTTTKHQEVFTFLRPSWDAYDAKGKVVIRPELVPDLDSTLNERYPTFPFYRPEGPNTTIRLARVRPGVLYVFGGKSNISPREQQDHKMATTGSGTGGSGGAARGRVKKTVAEKCGHLVPMEDPKLCAKAAAEWVQDELKRWWDEENKYQEWTKRSKEEKTTVSAEYKSHIGKPGGPKPKAKI